MAALKGRRRPSSHFGSRTDVGCIREINEDSLAVAPPLYVVCDGMGGHEAGEIASEIAVEVIQQRAPEHPDSEALGKAVEEANLAILAEARKGTGSLGMGCTCTAAILEKEKLAIAQVGDSRAYLLHNGKMQQITRDHSLVADLVEAGQITEAEARVHPQRSMITRALGSDPRTVPDLYEVNVEAGDRLLLCSDGLSTMMEDPQIEAILMRSADPQRCAAQLVNEAISLGGYDNITVIVVDVAGLAEQRQRKMTRKARTTAIMICLLLAAIIGGCVYGFNYLVSNSAYLAEQDGKVAIYQGVPGDVLGITSNKLIRVTDIDVDDLQPGTAKNLRENTIRLNSLQEAEDLVANYQQQIDESASSQDAASQDAASQDAANAGTSDAAAASASGTSTTGSNSSSKDSTSTENSDSNNTDSSSKANANEGASR